RSPELCGSVMADGTVTRHVPLEVTANAETHVVDVIDFPDLRHAGHVAMTGAAGFRPHRLDVDHMGEMHVARQGMHPGPLEHGGVRLLAIIPELAQLA